MAQLKKSTSSKRTPVYGKASSATKPVAKAAPAKKVVTKSQIAAAKKSASVKVTSASVAKIPAKAPANRKTDNKQKAVSSAASSASRAKPASKISYAPTNFGGANFGNGGENVIKLGTDMMRKFMSGEEIKNSTQAFKTTEKSVENVSRAFGDAVSASKSNFEACVECGNHAAKVSKTIGEQVTSYINNTIAQNVGISKELMACRNPKDAMEIQGRMFRNNVDGFFSEAAQISEMLFQCAADAVEPINQRVSEASKKIKTVFSA